MRLSTTLAVVALIRFPAFVLNLDAALKSRACQALAMLVQRPNRIGSIIAVALCAIALGLAPEANATDQQLPKSVRALMNKHKMPYSSLSVVVKQIGAKRPEFQHRAGVVRNPASVMKLVTTATALRVLGPAYQFPTEVYAARKPSAGVVKGDLYLKGYGDPFMVTENFWRLAKDLRELGVRRVGGNLILDNSYFSVPAHDPGRFDKRPYRAYNTGPDALLLNFFATRFRFFPDSKAMRVIADPELSNLKINNSARVVGGRCTYAARAKLAFRVISKGPKPEVGVKGSYPASCAPHDRLRAVVDPVAYSQGLFTATWRQLGGEFNGIAKRGTVPAKYELLHRSKSLPLSMLLHYINKFSNNVMTRNLLLAAGAKQFGAPGTLDKGRRAVAEYAKTLGIAAAELKVDNGSGLSRTARISAQTLSDLLEKVYRSDYMAEFIATLPIASVDGTMKRRLKKTSVAGKAHMKTGLLRGVRSIAGYLRDRRGRTFVVVMLHNHPGVQNTVGTQVQDAFLKWLISR